MNNHTQKPKSKQNADIKALRDAWHADMKATNDQKDALGYGALSREDFLALVPGPQDGQVQSSEMLALQDRYKILYEERDTLWVDDIVVAELNKKHAVLHSDQFSILTEKPSTLHDGIDFTLESKQSFKSMYENKIVECPDGIMRSKADIWLKHPNRREYHNVVFDPLTDPKTLEERRCYNIWKGFAVRPIPGDCSRYWEHVHDNICSKNDHLYRYVRKWLAFVFQRPDKIHTALVLCGSQGVGKNKFVDPLGVLLGQHYAPLGNITELVGHFNFHLKDAVVVHANESFWGGHKSEVGVLKAMITENTCYIEGKGKDRIKVRNYKHVIISSNEDWPVSLDPDDRRFLVLNVSDAQKENATYFAALDHQLQNGGHQALLYDLLQEDISDFKPAPLPRTSGSFEIKMRSADSAHNYIYEALNDGGFYIGSQQNDDPSPTKNAVPTQYHGLWQPEIPKESVYADYVLWCRLNGHKQCPNNQFGKTLKKLLSSLTEARRGADSRRIRVHVLPTLQKAREEFCIAFKETSAIWEH